MQHIPVAYKVFNVICRWCFNACSNRYCFNAIYYSYALWIGWSIWSVLKKHPAELAKACLIHLWPMGLWRGFVRDLSKSNMLADTHRLDKLTIFGTPAWSSWSTHYYVEPCSCIFGLFEMGIVDFGFCFSNLMFEICIHTRFLDRYSKHHAGYLRDWRAVRIGVLPWKGRHPYGSLE